MVRIPKSEGTRVLLIDNYSSFSFNLLQYVAQITGLGPTCLRNDEPLPLDLSSYDCVVISPGPGTPERATDMGLSRYFLEECRLPVLGICLGHQGLAYAFGSTLVRCEEPMHGRRSEIEHEEHPLFAGIPRQFKAVRYHSLAVTDPLPGMLDSIARSEDGTIMAIAHRQLPKWGVQFHPESMQTEFGHLLLKNFCEMSVASRAGLPSVEVPVVRNTPPEDSSTGKHWTLVRHALPSGASARELYTRLFAGSNHSFWLDGESCDQGVSYMGDAEGAGAHVLRYDDARELLVRESGGQCEEIQVESIFDYLAQELAGHQVTSAGRNMAFCGGYVGYFGYELGRETRYESEYPDAQWIWVDRFLAFDHREEQAFLLALVLDGDPRASTEAEDWFAAVEQLLATEDCPKDTVSETGDATPRLVMRDSAEEYREKIEECIAAIRAGESYELCLTTALDAGVTVDPLGLFLDTRKSNPAPYAAFLCCPEFAVVSSSPERFLRIDAGGLVESKPIKGTAKRSLNKEEDRMLAAELVACEKERAENLMIVDLVRNDLGRSCEIGSVRVVSFAKLESFETVHQLVSTIEGKLRAEVAALHCVRDAFPAGSMTGAPKIRSMQILEGLESGARGIYSGSIGYLSIDGAVDLNVVIRTIVVEKTKVSIGVGGAITVLSEPDSELAEVFLKAQASVAALSRRGQESPLVIG